MGRRKVLYFYSFLIYGSGRVGLGWVESGRVGSGWVGLEVWPGCIGAVLCGTMMTFVAMGDNNDGECATTTTTTSSFHATTILGRMHSWKRWLVDDYLLLILLMTALAAASSVVTYDNQLNGRPSAVDCNDDDNDMATVTAMATAKVKGTAKAMVVALAETTTTTVAVAAEGAAKVAELR